MKTPQDPEAAETVQTTSVPAVVQERLVRLLPCPFCGSEAEITDESQPDRPRSWFFAWCKNRPECNCWLADGSPEKVAAKWNRRPDHGHVFRWRHAPDEPYCSCAWPNIWLTFPFECGNCHKRLPEISQTNA